MFNCALHGNTTLTFCVPVTEGRGSHVTEAQGPLAAAVHKQVAVLRVKLCCCYHLRQVLHVGGFDVYNVCEEAPSRNINHKGVEINFSNVHELLCFYRNLGGKCFFSQSQPQITTKQTAS